MRYRPLGPTGLWVSEVALGAMTIGGSADDVGDALPNRPTAANVTTA